MPEHSFLEISTYATWDTGSGCNADPATGDPGLGDRCRLQFKCPLLIKSFIVDVIIYP